MAEVLIVGAGPVGLTLACELARHGVGCRIIDRLREPLPYCRAIGVTPRTLEIWEDLGVAREMIDAGLWLRGMRSLVSGQPPRDVLQEFPDLPYSVLAIPQPATERVLTDKLHQLGIVLERGTKLIALSQDKESVTAEVERYGGARETATFDYLVGCDGAHSVVRHQLEIPFEGDAMGLTFMLGDVHIDWDLPRGMALRSLRLREDAAPDMFLAIPLPDTGRYRVSMLAPPELLSAGGDEHGVQTEFPSPKLEYLQQVADDLLDTPPRLTDLRWSSCFRISMRLAARYGKGRCFLAGDAAHIHPPTGGQGMNTGIQDAYNLAWKLGLALRADARDSLLDSYEAERRAVGADVVARTLAASLAYGRESQAPPPHRLADTQILVSYRDSPWVRDDVPLAAPGDPTAEVAAGDRAPDCHGLRRSGVGFSYRLFDLLRGPEHVLLAYLTDGKLADNAVRLSELAAALEGRYGTALRVVAIVPSGEREGLIDPPHMAAYEDADGEFVNALGATARAWLVRPDGYLGWRGADVFADGLREHLARIFGPR